MNTISCNLTNEQRKKCLDAWREFKVNKEMPYIEFQCKVENCTITSYTSGKVVFQGKDADIYASPYTQVETKQTNKSSHLPVRSHAGSDEVGTGDYFGPVCVCACLVLEKDIEWLCGLQVNDSKQIKDETILKIAPELIKRLPHSLLILNNERYNIVQKTNNLNQIKAKLHNQAYLHLQNKVKTLPELCVIDQFTPKNTYFKYLYGEPNIFQQLHFETKAESKYLAVASASIIARYAFLMTWEKLEEKYNMKLTKGAGDQVNCDAKKFIEKYGISELNKIAKLHFKNSEYLK